MLWCLLACSLLSAPKATSETQDWRALLDAWTYPAPIPDFQLVDQQGSSFQLGQFRDDYLLVSFVFTRCGMSEACPLTMTRLAAVQESWKNSPDTMEVWPWR